MKLNNYTKLPERKVFFKLVKLYQQNLLYLLVLICMCVVCLWLQFNTINWSNFAPLKRKTSSFAFENLLRPAYVSDNIVLTVKLFVDAIYIIIEKTCPLPIYCNTLFLHITDSSMWYCYTHFTLYQYQCCYFCLNSTK